MTPYQEAGYASRTEYLKALAEEHDVPVGLVFDAAFLLGPDEDFDGLVTLLEEL